MIISWALILVAVVLVLGGLFSVLVVFSLSRSATGGDLDWQIARLERKVDLILTHLGIGHDDHVPERVVGLAQNGRAEDAIKEYCRVTGLRASVARREVQYLLEKLRERKGIQRSRNLIQRRTNGVPRPMHEPSWEDAGEFEDRPELDEELTAQIKAELDPLEYLLWADRPIPPPALRVPLIPALFISVVAGLSGFSLAATFGLVGEAWLDPMTMILALGLGPAVLGGLIFAHLISVLIRRWLKRRRLARLIYAVTDHRAIVGADRGGGGEAAVELAPSRTGARRRAGSRTMTARATLFLGAGNDSRLPLGFLEVPHVGFVESLVREALVESRAGLVEVRRDGVPSPLCSYIRNDRNHPRGR